MNNLLLYNENEAININQNDRDTNVTGMFPLNRILSTHHEKRKEGRTKKGKKLDIVFKLLPNLGSPRLTSH